MSASLSFTISGPQAEELKERIRSEALRRGQSMSELITEAVSEYLEATGG